MSRRSRGCSHGLVFAIFFGIILPCQHLPPSLSPIFCDFFLPLHSTLRTLPLFSLRFFPLPHTPPFPHPPRLSPAIFFLSHALPPPHSPRLSSPFGDENRTFQTALLHGISHSLIMEAGGVERWRRKIKKILMPCCTIARICVCLPGGRHHGRLWRQLQSPRQRHPC